MEKWYPLIARVLIALLFLGGGFKFMNIAGTTAYIDSVGIPMASIVFWLSTLLEVGAAIALIVGFQIRLAAWSLFGYTALTILLFHNNIADQMQFTMALKNLAIMGGLLLIATQKEAHENPVA